MESLSDDRSRILPKGSVSGDCYLIHQDKCSRCVLWSSLDWQIRTASVYIVHCTKFHALQTYDFFFSLAVYDSFIWIFYYGRERAGGGGDGGWGGGVKETSKMICTLVSVYQCHTSIQQRFLHQYRFCGRQSKRWWTPLPTSMQPPPNPPNPTPPTPTLQIFYRYLKKKG